MSNSNVPLGYEDDHARLSETMDNTDATRIVDINSIAMKRDYVARFHGMDDREELAKELRELADYVEQNGAEGVLFDDEDDTGKFVSVSVSDEDKLDHDLTMMDGEGWAQYDDATILHNMVMVMREATTRGYIPSQVVMAGLDRLQYSVPSRTFGEWLGIERDTHTTDIRDVDAESILYRP